MKQLIDKSDLTAEIEKRKSELQSRIAELGTFESNTLGLFQDVDLYDDIISFLNTLETKDVDLEKELNEWRHNHFHGRRDDKGANGEYLTRVSQLEIAEYFYGLGLKVQKGE